MRIILDCNNLCTIVRYAQLGGLTYQEASTGVIFGFLRYLPMFAKAFESREFIFCWDSRKRRRSEIYPDYKKNRTENKTEEERQEDLLYYKQFDIIRMDILPKVGFKNNFIVAGFEADDLIAQAVKQLGFEKTVIVSSDTDLYQLLSPNVVMFSPRSKKIYTEKDFKEEFGIVPEQWAEVKAIAGCGSDNVKGIPSVGENTAIQYIKGQLKSTYKTYTAIKNGEKTVKRNRQLVKLPFKGTPHLNIKEQGHLSEDNFLYFAREYGLTSFIKNLEHWRTHLGLI